MKKIIYKNSPLIEVILQVKFPTILSINSKEPAEFQELIRQEFPIYQVAMENEQEIALQQLNDGIIPSVVKTQQQKNYMFISRDGQCKINLTSGFISISTLDYSSWEDLIKRFSDPLKCFIDIYKPAFFERVGIRYVDAYSRKKLGIEDKKWSDLIQENLLGVLASTDENLVRMSSVDTEYVLDDTISIAKIHAGLGSINNSPEKVFVIDSDFIKIDNIDIADFSIVAEYLHSQASAFIKSAIKPILHEAMVPEELE